MPFDFGRLEMLLKEREIIKQLQQKELITEAEETIMHNKLNDEVHQILGL